MVSHVDAYRSPVPLAVPRGRLIELVCAVKHRSDARIGDEVTVRDGIDKGLIVDLVLLGV